MKSPVLSLTKTNTEATKSKKLLGHFVQLFFIFREKIQKSTHEFPLMESSEGSVLSGFCVQIITVFKLFLPPLDVLLMKHLAARQQTASICCSCLQLRFPVLSLPLDYCLWLMSFSKTKYVKKHDPA